MQLKEVKRGETFEHCGHKWIVLEHDDTGHTLALSEDIIGEMPFDEDNCNNWAKSSLRDYLAKTFLLELCEGRKPENHGFAPYTLDLTADDGLKDYGSSTDLIFLLTADLYRRNRDVIEPIDSWWWTATAYSALASDACNSRDVDTDGTLSISDAYDGNGGVRPACYLKSDLLLSESEDQMIEREIGEKIFEIEKALKLDPKTRKTVLKAVLNFVTALLEE